MAIYEVHSATTEKQFLELPARLYRDDPNWTPQLGKDVAFAFHPDKNRLLTNGNAKRWLAFDRRNRPSGRIAAFYHPVTHKAGIGFFESSPDETVASALFESALDWLEHNGCKSVDGPINFGEKDRFWGLMTTGFDSPVLYLDNYNPPWYESLFRQQGFESQEEILTYSVRHRDIDIQRLASISDRFNKKQEVVFRCFDWLHKNALANDIHAIYRQAFSEDTRMAQLTPSGIGDLIEAAKPVLDSTLFWIAYSAGKPVGLVAFLQDLNQQLRRSMGRPVTNETNLKGFALAVTPPFQRKGLDAALACRLYHALTEEGKDFRLYFSGINSRSRSMHALMEALGASVSKIHRTYSYKIV